MIITSLIVLLVRNVRAADANDVALVPHVGVGDADVTGVVVIEPTVVTIVPVVHLGRRILDSPVTGGFRGRWVIVMMVMYQAVIDTMPCRLHVRSSF